MSRALVVSMPAKLEADKIAGWLARMVHGVSVDPSNGEWGIFVPPAALHRARAAFRRVISANPGGTFRVYTKHGSRPYLRLRRPYRSVREAAAAADAAVMKSGALKAVVIDRRGKVHFVAFDRRRVTGNPLTDQELRQLIAGARADLRDTRTHRLEGRFPNAIATAGYALGRLSAAAQMGRGRYAQRAAWLARYADRTLNRVVDKTWEPGALGNPAKLLTKDDQRRLPALYSQEKAAEPIAYVKFFTPWTYWTWYATEYDQQDTFFGLVQGHEEELGYFSLAELSKIRGPGGLRIERDLHFTPTPLSKLRKRATANRRAGAGRNPANAGNGKAAPYTLLVMGRRIPVRNWSEASNALGVIRDRTGLGYSKMGAEFPIYRGRTVVAYVSYNGKVWKGKPGDWPKATLLYDPYAAGRNRGTRKLRRRGARRNPGSREYMGYAKLEGVPVRIAAEYWADRWKVYGYPTAQGKQTDHYREIRRKLGDDWDFDITDTWAEADKLPRKMQEQIADLTMPGWRTRSNTRRRRA